MTFFSEKESHTFRDDGDFVSLTMRNFSLFMVSAVLIQKSNIVEANNICLSPGECQGGIPADSKIIAR